MNRRALLLATTVSTFCAMQAHAAGPNFSSDVYIDGSLCVGFDCVFGQAFGFDTVILKENNLRVFFDDTSASGSFPSNDWGLHANDTDNGGANYFAVVDRSANRQVFRVDAGARANALYVDSQGDLGLGTSVPAVDIDVKQGNTRPSACSRTPLRASPPRHGTLPATKPASSSVTRPAARPCPSGS